MRIGSAGSTNINVLQSDIFTFRNADFVVDNEGAISSGLSIPALAGNFSMLQLFNPIASGITVLLDGFTAGLTAVGTVWIRFTSAVLANDTDKAYNHKVGEANGLARLRWEQGGVLSGTTWLPFKVPADVSIDKVFRFPIELVAGKGVFLIPDVVNVGLVASYNWREV